MKTQVQQLIVQAIESLIESNTLEVEIPEVKIERCRDKAHGDFAANIAMVLAKQAKRNPRELAQLIVEALPENDLIEKADIAGPGFINFAINSSMQQSVVEVILSQGEAYGRSDFGQNKKVQIEFVSANPTGPLHVGHGRGAAYGATLANLLSAVGYDVHKEYYVNDAGRQMDILGTSVWLRYLQAQGVDIPFPVNGYRGDYIKDIVAVLQKEQGDSYVLSAEQVLADLPADEDQGGDKEAYIDAMIAQAKQLLGSDRYDYVFKLALNSILDDIRDDLGGFGVNFDNWYSEKSLLERGLVDKWLERLEQEGHLYRNADDGDEGPLWFRSTAFGDDKDRVVRRANGQITYFASDIAYHMDKFERGFETVIDVWGADHHGYVPRVKAALSAMQSNPDNLNVLLVQFANLYRQGEKVQMSTRSGSFVTLRELREEVGDDAARFFYVMRKCEQHLDFDLDLAKSKSSENPVYYIQYAHARICSVLRQLDEKSLAWDKDLGLASLDSLSETHEQDLMQLLQRYPEVLKDAATKHEPHLLVHYLRDSANALHSYYNKHHFIVDDEKLRAARLSLIIAARHVLANGLNVLGVSAPEEM